MTGLDPPAPIAFDGLIGWRSVGVVPYPSVTDFKPGLLQGHRKFMHISGGGECCNQSPGFENPQAFRPDCLDWQGLVPDLAVYVDGIGGVGEHRFNRSSGHCFQFSETVASEEVSICFVCKGRRIVTVCGKTGCVCRWKHTIVKGASVNHLIAPPSSL